MSGLSALKRRTGILLSGAAALALAFAVVPAEAASKQGHKDSSSHAEGVSHDSDHGGGHGGAGKQRKGKGGKAIGRGGGHKSLRDVFQDMVDEVDDHGTGHSDTGDHAGKKQSGKKAGAGSSRKASGAAKPKKPSVKVADEPDDDSDRPDWAGTPGREGKPGQPNPNPGSKKGDLFGDMYVLLRDENGVPILTPEGFLQPVDADGNPLPLDDEGHLIDEDAAIEVELGRLNVGRAPERVLSVRYEEVLKNLNTADEISVDVTGRITYTIDGVVKTIDSPLENLALYVELMNTGTLDGIVDTSKFTGELANLVDGTLTIDDYADAVAFFAAASDKTGSVSIDQIVYMNAITGVEGTLPDGYVQFTDDPFSFDYNREDIYGDVTVEVLVQQPDGTWVPTTVNVYETVFTSTNYVSDDGGVDGFAQAADDAREVIEFVHEYAVPTTTATQ